ncbi:hypothetical protein FJZ55_09865 [Candidatus Woesearchaeota archaeon]|nr:hypothetical protein [Candidatus Woesearchaeota archaeon]
MPEVPSVLAKEDQAEIKRHEKLSRQHDVDQQPAGVTNQRPRHGCDDKQNNKNKQKIEKTKMNKNEKLTVVNPVSLSLVRDGPIALRLRSRDKELQQQQQQQPLVQQQQQQQHPLNGDTMLCRHTSTCCLEGCCRHNCFGCRARRELLAHHGHR